MRAAELVGRELSVALSDDAELRELNRRFADEDHATDVLSFAQDEGPPIGAKGPLGDVVISVETADRQARAGGRTRAAELFHLAVHGLVHLLGYDHATPEEERRMFGYEAELRAAAKARGPVARVTSPRRRRA
jgi:probable rRNA maturation factor